MSQPGNFGAGWAPDDSWLVRRIEDLERTVREMRAARTLESSSIGAGGLSVNAEGGISVLDQTTGSQVFYVGYAPMFDGSGRKQMVVYLFRGNDGSAAMTMVDAGTSPGHPFSQAMQWFDRSGKVVLADDTVGGQGIAVPYIPFGAFMSNSAPTDTTTSATFTTLQTSIGYWMNPKVFIQLLVRASDGTTAGEVRVIDQSSNVIGGVQTVTAGLFSYINIGPVAVPGNFKDSLSLNIQARRTSGAGTIGVRGIVAIGLQS